MEVGLKVTEAYQGLDPNDLLIKATDLGARYLRMSHSCGQSVVATLHDVIGFDDVLVKSTNSFCGGMAEQFLGTCGALTGGIMVIDYFFGRPIEKMSAEKYVQSNVDALEPAWRVNERLADRFVNEYGSLTCASIHRKLFGRILYLRDRAEAERFVASGKIEQVGKIVGNVVRWVLQILLDEGAIEL